MGYERKRGKLADLNLLLRGAGHDRFSLIVGDVARLAGVRYVITLDADTELPRDAARQLVGVMAHPLNTPRFDERKRRVVGGYGILQPRMAATLPGANRSRYAQLYGSEPGIDPYTRSVSDVYQDLFGEGSFIGKGIYDVDAFERACKERFPDNCILSHDLLEGCYARSGLLSDVLLYEDYPRDYGSDVAPARAMDPRRLADRQLADAARSGRRRPQRTRTRFPALSRWKIFDNLRRSLVPAALVLLTLIGWYVAPRAWACTLALVGLVAIPTLLHGLVALLRKPRELGLGRHAVAVARATGRGLAQSAIRIACLPHEAVVSLGAVAAHGVAHARCAPQAARVEPVRGTGRGEPRSRRQFPHDVGGPVHVRRGARGTCGRRTGGPLRRPADPRALVRGTRHRLVAESPAAAPRGRAVRGPVPLPAQDRAQDLGDSSTRLSARRTTGFRPTISRRSRARRSRIAPRRRTSASCCSRT